MCLQTLHMAGSCCVDEVAAQHIDANALVHYGHACMSQTYRLPVIYVFGKKPIDVEHCVTSLLDSFASTSSSSSSNRRNNVVLRHDVAYNHQAGQIAARLHHALENSKSRVLYTPIPDKLLPLSLTAAGSSQSASLNDSLPFMTETIQDSTIFYIGDESLGLTNLLMTHASCDVGLCCVLFNHHADISKVYKYSPTSKTSLLESGRTNKLLMRRYATMQKGRDADVFGILVGTLGVASYLPLIKHLRTLLAASHKKSYTISVGKLNPAKLANFMEIECFVLVACPENSLVEAKDFYRPIITPYELEVALRAEQSWTGKYVLNFGKLLAEYAQNDGVEVDESQEEDRDWPVFSLITGKYRHAKQYGPVAQYSTQAVSSPGSTLLPLVTRNQESALSVLQNSAAGQFLQARSYQGLDPRVGQDAPGALEQGRSGIARGYGSGGSEKEEDSIT
ncbi:hypothetical protein D9757_003177 [Collybiopsis confluens]|uniref:2-(3-amino-3-carboxypropyl)histidine synthase subunit 2 n=1 Tax=Collybiopsis confluens TaxID=2823264 RepID=A0A8H5ME50_9AGAR|nr:hypothetical protein D9757_003177 [Collybiopsis confluens]